MKAEDYAAYYAQLPDGELAKIASSRRTLVPDARVALDEEVAKRGWTPEDIRRFKNYRHSYRDPESPIQRKMRHSHLFDKVDEVRKMPTLRWRGILAIVVCTIPVALLFDHFGILDLVMPVYGTVAVLLLTIRFHWELKRRPWFWMVIAVWAALHAWMLVRVHWPHQWIPGRAWGGAATLDTVATFVIVALIEKLLHEGPFAPKARRTAN